jgi:phospholipase C
MGPGGVPRARSRARAAWVIGAASVVLMGAALVACGSDHAAAPALDAGVNLDDWDRHVTRRDETIAAAMRNACKFTRGALPAETLGASLPVGNDIPIDTIVVVMQENRSFDSYFARLAEYTGRKYIDTASPETLVPERTGVVSGPMHRLTHAEHLCNLDTNHEWGGTHLEYDDGKMDGFYQANVNFDFPPPGAPPGVTDAARALTWLDERDIPFYYALAATFAMSDRYFSSLLGPTWPNRDYLYMATSLGIVDESFPDVSAYPYPKRDMAIFDELEKRGVSWNVYADGLPPEFVSMGPSMVTRYGRNPLLHTSDFFDQAKAGTLPSVAFVDAFFGKDGPARDDEHPPADVQLGQELVSHVVHALFESPQWPGVAMFFTYDEHGGYYDHVAPPSACPPDAIEPQLPASDTSGEKQRHFDRLGVRVPFVLVSPYARQNFVSHVVHDHTSITRFIETKFRLPALTARDANADPMLEMFDFAAPPFMTPPALPDAVVDQTELAYCVKTFTK